MRSQAVYCMLMPSFQWKILYRLCPYITASVVFSSNTKILKTITLKILTLFFIFTHYRDENHATQSWILRYLQRPFISAFICSLTERSTFSCEICIHGDISIILFTLAQKIMHTRKRHQDMFQDLNRKLQHAEKDRESPPVDSKPGKRWSVSSGGSDKTNLSVSFLANLFFKFPFPLSHTLLANFSAMMDKYQAIISIPGLMCFWREVLVQWVASVSQIPSLLFGSDKTHCDWEAEKASWWGKTVKKQTNKQKPVPPCWDFQKEVTPALHLFSVGLCIQD